MKRSVVWTETAERDLDKLDRQVARRILRAITRLADTGHGDVARLKEPLGGLRLRVGAWRVRFLYEEGSGAMRILHIRHRGEAYDNH